jgi:hypothetical protein
MNVQAEWDKIDALREDGQYELADRMEDRLMGFIECEADREILHEMIACGAWEV